MKPPGLHLKWHSLANKRPRQKCVRPKTATSGYPPKQGLQSVRGGFFQYFSNYYRAHTKYDVFRVSVLLFTEGGGGGGGGGGPGKCTIWLMSQGLSTFWLKSALDRKGGGGGLGGGGNIPECHAGCLYKHHALLLTCYQSAHLLSKGSTEGLHQVI